MKHVTHLTHDVYTYVYNSDRYGIFTHRHTHIYINTHTVIHICRSRQLLAGLVLLGTGRGTVKIW